MIKRILYQYYEDLELGEEIEFFLPIELQDRQHKYKWLTCTGIIIDIIGVVTNEIRENMILKVRLNRDHEQRNEIIVLTKPQILNKLILV